MYECSRAGSVSGSTRFTYTASRNGYHAIAVVNDGIVYGSYSLRYGQCVAPAALANRIVTATGNAVASYSFVPPNASWMAVGVRSWEADWDMKVGTSTGPDFPGCVGGD